jgi:steroid 5-alpha reductase family enzyme
MEWRPLVPVAFAGLGVVLAAATLVWLLSLRLRDASIADVAWGPGFVLLAATWALLSDGYGPRRLLVLALVSVWGLRLALHIAARNRGKGEDPRYRRFRERAGPTFPFRSLITVFWLQALLLWIAGAPLLPALASDLPARFTPFDALGLLLWSTGFLFETIGDAQLRRFKADPANRVRVLRSGLWRYTRHPNYFGDATLWWGFWCFAASVPCGAVTAFGPALMTFLLVRVSGVRMLEEDLLERKPEYRDYVRSTNAFVPGPPRRAPE